MQDQPPPSQAPSPQPNNTQADADLVLDTETLMADGRGSVPPTAQAPIILPQPTATMAMPPMLPPLPIQPPATTFAGARALMPVHLGSLPGTPMGFAVTDSGAHTPSLLIPPPTQTPTSPRPLNVKDALSYLEMVKIKFSDQPDVYNHFLDIMKDFKSQTIDTPGVIERVSSLFTGHPILIQGFNTFLPAGYRIECSQDGQDTNVIVTTPSGTTTTTAGATMNLSRVGGGAQKMPTSAWTPNSIPLIPNQTPYTPDGSVPAVFGADQSTQPEFNHAIQFVNRIKTRFAQETDTYKQFLEILQKYQKERRPYQEVYDQVTVLFRTAPDLIDEFKQFLPDPNGGGLFGVLAGAGASEIDKTVEKDLRRRPAAAAPAPTPPVPEKTAAPKQRKKRVLDKEAAAAPKAGQSKPKRSKLHHKPEPQSPPFAPAGSPGPSPSYVNGTSNTLAPVPTSIGIPDEAVFFDRVKKYIDDKATYQDFLKLLNLFTQEIIDIRTLVDRAASFLGDGELFLQFKDILGWDDRAMVEVEGGLRGVQGVIAALDRPKVDLNTCKKHGPSYRKLPKSESSLACSGRDAMCWEVLNDEWVSHPTWASEDAGFSTHKKNLFEEALHKCEEERHEYDFHVEAIVRTIQVLEPIMQRINNMDSEERTHFKLKPGLGGQGKSIYQRIIKKVYGKEHGLEIVQALHDSPSIVIPVVLTRLKQKDEEWKRAQREWNKVWREVDGRNYYKSLDHQGVNFKVNDKKTLASKQLIQDIEAKRKEQAKERAKLIDPLFVRTLPKDHFAFKLDDSAVLQDCVKLIVSFLDRTSAVQFSRSDKTQIESFLRSFIPLFFALNSAEFNAALDAGSIPVAPVAAAQRHSDAESDDAASDTAMEDGDDSSAALNGRKGGRKGGASGGANGTVAGEDLRKRLLKNGAQGKGKGKQGRSQSSSRGSPAPVVATLASDAMAVDSAESSGEAIEGVEAGASGSFMGSAEWVKYDAADGEAAAASAFKPRARDTSTGRKTNFFANNAIYVFLRQLQILYSRLHMCKTAAQGMAAEKDFRSWRANPVAVRLGLHDHAGSGQSRLVDWGPNRAGEFYDYLLICCEQLFDGDIEPAAFEDNLRFMFGIKAYLMFTIDKVIAVVIKQIQTIISDAKSQDLLTMLQKERELENPTTQQLINYRREAEALIGIDENCYRICWSVPSMMMQIQLLSHDDTTTDDASSMTERWRHYIESYTLPHQTEGLSFEVKPPLIKRSIDPEQEDSLDTSSYISRANLQIKICIRTYRLFFVAGTEDFYWRIRPAEEVENLRATSLSRKEEKKKTLESWLNSKIVPPPISPETHVTAVADRPTSPAVENATSPLPVSPAKPTPAPAKDMDVDMDQDPVGRGEGQGDENLPANALAPLLGVEGSALPMETEAPAPGGDGPTATPEAPQETGDALMPISE